LRNCSTHTSYSRFDSPTKAQEIVPLLVDGQSKVCPTHGGSPLRSDWNYGAHRNKPGQRRGDAIKVIFI